MVVRVHGVEVEDVEGKGGVRGLERRVDDRVVAWVQGKGVVKEIGQRELAAREGLQQIKDIRRLESKGLELVHPGAAAEVHEVILFLRVRGGLGEDPEKRLLCYRAQGNEVAEGFKHGAARFEGLGKRCCWW